MGRNAVASCETTYDNVVVSVSDRYFREARLPRIAPISQELVLAYVAEHVLGLPRSH